MFSSKYICIGIILKLVAYLSTFTKYVLCSLSGAEGYLQDIRKEERSLIPHLSSYLMKLGKEQKKPNQAERRKLYKVKNRNQ